MELANAQMELTFFGLKTQIEMPFVVQIPFNPLQRDSFLLRDIP